MNDDIDDFQDEDAALPEEETGEEESHGLSFIKPRHTKRVMKARSERHTKTISRLRIALPVAAILVLITLFVWPIVKPERVKKAVIKNIPDLVIDNLHFTGLDSKNEPYSMTALKATRPSDLTNIYDLEKPEGEITLASGTWLDLKATQGRYDQDNRRLWLGGKVEVFHDKGYTFTSTETQVNLRDNYAWGDKPVLIQGNFGTITGDGFRLLDSGHIMVVTGPAHAVLYLRQGPSSDKPSEPPK